MCRAPPHLVAVHTSEQAGTGAGGSAAARVSVGHAQPRADIEQLGAHLGWHGGLTLDYLHQNGTPPGVHTHSALALMPGAAERSGSRLAALRALMAGPGRRGGLRDSHEVLTPLPADPLSLTPVQVVASQLPLQPGRARPDHLARAHAGTHAPSQHDVDV